MQGFLMSAQTFKNIVQKNRKTRQKIINKQKKRNNIKNMEKMENMENIDREQIGTNKKRRKHRENIKKNIKNK